MPPQNTDPETEEVTQILMELMAVLWSHGRIQVSVGALMRVLGVENSNAAKHDDEYIMLDETFVNALPNSNIDTKELVGMSPSTTIH